MENSIKPLLQAPLWQMTGEQFLTLTQFALSSLPKEGISLGVASGNEKAVGVHALAQKLGCSESMIYTLIRERILDEAIISRIGKRFVFDVERARILADTHQRNKRLANQEVSPVVL